MVDHVALSLEQADLHLVGLSRVGEERQSDPCLKVGVRAMDPALLPSVPPSKDQCQKDGRLDAFKGELKVQRV